MNIQPLLTRKKIALTLAGLLFLVVISAGFSGGVVIINAPKDNSLTGYIKNLNKPEDESRVVTVARGGWSLQLLRSANYHIVFQNSNAESLYQKQVGIFSFATIDAQVKKQRVSQNLGYYNSDCLLHDNTSGQLAYYYCQKALEPKFFYSLTRDGLAFSDYASGSSIQPYLGGVLELQATGSDQQINRVEFNDNKLQRVASVAAPPKTARPQVRLITDVVNKESRLFVYHDVPAATLSVYSSVAMQPKKYDLKKYLKSDPNFETEVKIIGSNLYIFNGLRPETVEFGDFIDQEINEPQTITIISTKTGEKIQTISIDDDFYTKQFAVGTGGLVSLLGQTKNNVIKIFTLKNNSLVDTATTNDPLDICWAGSSLYYISNQWAIYEYDPMRGASYLVYKNPSEKVITLNCAFGSVSFPTLSRDNSGSDYRWFELTNNPLSEKTTRLENIFPIIEDRIGGILLADIFKNSVRVELGNPDEVGGLSDTCAVSQQDSERVTTYIRSLGVDINGLDFSFSRRC